MNAALDPSRLYVILDKTALRSKDPNLYQLLYNLIGNLVNLSITTASTSAGTPSSTTINNITQAINQLLLDGGSGGEDGLVVPGPAGPTGATGAIGPTGPAGVVGSLQLISLDEYYDETNITIGSTITSGSGIDTYAAPLTNGDATLPELIFDSFGDVVMVTELTTP
jgi:hypothetical protein